MLWWKLSKNWIPLLTKLFQATRISRAVWLSVCDILTGSFPHTGTQPKSLKNRQTSVSPLPDNCRQSVVFFHLDVASECDSLPLSFPSSSTQPLDHNTRNDLPRSSRRRAGPRPQSHGMSRSGQTQRRTTETVGGTDEDCLGFVGGTCKE